MIELQGLTKTYKTPSGSLTALDDINLRVAPGEIFGIIGKSGAGKSTLIRCVNLLEQPSAGVIRVAGQEITGLTKFKLRNARRQMGMIFQHFNLLSSRTVYNNIALPLQLASTPKAIIETKVNDLLELTGLSDKKNTYPSQLSGGQKQRVAIARALANEPKVLLCDEATSALDPPTTQSILKLLKDINKKLNLTILLITHEMDVVKTICDKVAVIDNGNIIEQGDIIDFFMHPKTAVSEEFVNSCFSKELPTTISNRLLSSQEKDSTPLVRISFVGSSASEPIIAHLIQEIKLDVNILQANIEVVKDNPIGIMIVQLEGKQKNIDAGINYLKEKNLNVEVLGYVASNATRPV